ncbi:DUF4303 domain-containing protein [Pseudomonas sp. NPDC090201]|jgi:hypothetical protein|uniref:DUF4303 domain-containing protein n=1 Tax=Pseudomonas sp. NPDC090201 TaxID=3364475 RepID=UPI00381C3DB3
MNWSELQECIYNSTKNAFIELCEGHSEEEFYAFVLYTDSSVMSISPSANSIEALDEKIEQELDDEDRTPANEAYYKWAFSEWAYETVGGEFFRGINKSLRESAERSDFEEFKRKVLDAMIGALDLLVKERFFDSISKAAEGAVVFASMADDDASESIENESAKVINSTSTYDKFLVRYDVN